MDEQMRVAFFQQQSDAFEALFGDEKNCPLILLLSNKVEETDTSPDRVVAEDLGQKHLHDFDETAILLMTDKDDDLCNVATDGGDDTIESGDILILNSLIGHGSPHSLQLCGTIGTTEVLIDKEVDKEVQYDVYILHILIPFLKRLNDQYIKKKKMKAAMQRRLWDLGIKKKKLASP
ncbi:hypothetical protein Tco_0583162 [Tanacetum coccineum]